MSPAIRLPCCEERDPLYELVHYVIRPEGEQLLRELDEAGIEPRITAKIISLRLKDVILGMFDMTSLQRAMIDEVMSDQYLFNIIEQKEHYLPRTMIFNIISNTVENLYFVNLDRITEIVEEGVNGFLREANNLDSNVKIKYVLDEVLNEVLDQIRELLIENIYPRVISVVDNVVGLTS